MSAHKSLEKLIESFHADESPDWSGLETAIYERIKKSALRVAGHSDGSVSFGATSLTHETFARLMTSSYLKRIKDVDHFFALFTVMLRQVFADHHRKRKNWKNGGRARHVSLESAIHQLESSTGLAYDSIDECLTMLAEKHPQHARALTMQTHMGMEVAEIAMALGFSKSAVEKRLKFAKAFVRRFLEVPGTNSVSGQ